MTNHPSSGAKSQGDAIRWDSPTPPTVRERIRRQLPADVARDFDAICEWEDAMLEHCTDLATRLDAVKEAVSGR